MNIGQFLLVFGTAFTLACCESVEDDVFHFTNPSQGNVVWILDESSLPWNGGYGFLRSLSGMPTALLSIVDSSTGVTLGQCVAPQDLSGNMTKRWEQFQWSLTKNGLQCSYESAGNAPSQTQFPTIANPRTFSVRIQSITGPACIRDLVVQNENPTGCPPHLSKNSFTAVSLNCSCPYLDSSNNEDGEIESEDSDMLANTPQFPLFKGIEPNEAAPTTQWTLSPSPCAGHECQNNGTCLVSQEGTATCLCRNGFTGDRCELDVCSSVPCQNGGVCRSNSGIAYCDCPPSFTGLLCESVNDENQSATPICDPECSNGQCVLNDGNLPVCECRQGFTGANCNVLDVCLGDAACSMFGSAAKCVLDDNMDNMTSTSLINGTYDCLCPHPINGQFVECIQLHAPHASSIEPEMTKETTLPTVKITRPLSTDEPTTVATNAPVNVPMVSTTHQQSNVGETVAFTVTREPIKTADLMTTTSPFSHHIITAGETETTAWSSTQPTVEKVIPEATVGSNVPTQTQTTFIFPQTPETSQLPRESQEATANPIHKFISPNTQEGSNNKEEDDEEAEEESETFPTPSTMHVIPTDLMTSQSTFEESTTPGDFASPSTMQNGEEDGEEDEDIDNEDFTEEATQSSTSFFTESPSTMQTDPPSTTIEEEETTTDESEEVESEEMQTTQSGLPFWMTATTTKEVVEMKASTTPFVKVAEITTSTETVSNEKEEEEELEGGMMTTASNERNEMGTTMEGSTASDIVHHHTTSGKQTNAAASWIIAIIALIILGLLLLATSLFILRYIRQSRKLHGKYNPAREEHNLSAAYAMPMSHITKEERLI